MKKPASSAGPTADGSISVLAAYRDATRRGVDVRHLTSQARKALLHLGGDPARSSASLKQYDHVRFGPFLGVSDEGSASGQIREAAYDSPKVRALTKRERTPLAVGVALDAERLGGIGEVAAGPDEYTDVWLGCVDRLLITTNVGTRVNMRVYKREPIILLEDDSPVALEAAMTEIAAAFKPFVETPDKRPRPLTVFVDIPRYARITPRRKLDALKKLVKYVRSGKAAGKKKAPAGQKLGLSVWVSLGKRGRDESMAAVDLAADVGMDVVSIEGVKRKDADRAISLAGLLDYFAPGLVGPILRHAAKQRVFVRIGNLPDTDTIARSVWVGLTTARNYGANLGKYGCFPLTLEETDHVVEQIQKWFSDWSAAPVFFVDQGLIEKERVHSGNDVARGLKVWLETVAKHGVRVVLIDTVDKASGKRLLKSPKDKKGSLGMQQVKKFEKLAGKLGIKVLWAGGLGLADSYQMGKLGVFGIYVTTAAATTIAVDGSYARDPSLAGLKEPSREAVLRTKILLEAGFLSARLSKRDRTEVAGLAQALLAAHDAKDKDGVAGKSALLAKACETGWRAYWKTLSTGKKAELKSEGPHAA